MKRKYSMAKTNSDKYILIEIQEQRSTLNGGVMWRLRWYCVTDGTFHEMTVDSSYNNFKRCRWNQFVQEENPFGCYRNIYRTDRVTADGLGVVSADHRPELLVRVDNQQEAIDLVELDQAERNRKNKYGDLFNG